MKIKKNERDLIDERRASFQRLLSHQLEPQIGKKGTKGMFKNIIRKIKGKSEKEVQQERLHDARLKMLNVLEGIKKRQKDLEDISNTYLLVYEENLKKMRRVKPRRVTMPNGVFTDLVERGRSFFSPAQLKHALT